MHKSFTFLPTFPRPVHQTPKRIASVHAPDSELDCIPYQKTKYQTVLFHRLHVPFSGGHLTCLNRRVGENNHMRHKERATGWGTGLFGKFRKSSQIICKYKSLKCLAAASASQQTSSCIAPALSSPPLPPRVVCFEIPKHETIERTTHKPTSPHHRKTTHAFACRWRRLVSLNELQSISMIGMNKLSEHRC